METRIDALEDEDSRVRASAALALAKIRDPRAIEPLLARPKDSDYERERNAAVKALGKFDDPRVVEPLIAALEDNDASTRQSAAWGLGNSKDARAFQPLLTAIQDEEKWVRLADAESLIRRKDLQIVEKALAVLAAKDRPLDREAEAVVWMLGELRDPRAIGALQSVADNDAADPILRKTAKNAVSKIRTGEKRP
ncbi:MAG: HEAT repeat domain-containing protein [Planctomycetota bacterium]